MPLRSESVTYLSHFMHSTAPIFIPARFYIFSAKIILSTVSTEKRKKLTEVFSDQRNCRFHSLRCRHAWRISYNPFEICTWPHTMESCHALRVARPQTFSNLWAAPFSEKLKFYFVAKTPATISQKLPAAICTALWKLFASFNALNMYVAFDRVGVPPADLSGQFNPPLLLLQQTVNKSVQLVLPPSLSHATAWNFCFSIISLLLLLSDFFLKRFTYSTKR